MNYPAFFDSIAPLTLRDPLAQLLGVVEDGLITYTYLDMVKLAGHSCPTVAGAWIMCALGLAELYPEFPPTRGAIRVELRGAREEGVTGVLGNCIGFITGAADAGGFKGVAGHFARCNQLLFDADIDGEVRLTRLYQERSVTLSCDFSDVPSDPRLPRLLQGVKQGSAGSRERRELGQLWQARVGEILGHPERWREWVSMK